MNSRRPDSRADDMRPATTSRRALLTASGAVAIGALSGCLSQVASSVTNTGASPAAVFAGVDWNDDDTELTFTFEDELLREPHVSRLTPTLAGRVELEGWVTSSAVMAQDYNSSRSNKQQTRAADEDSDSDGDGVGDGSEEDAELVAYLGGKPIIAERFTVCLPDAAVPGGNGSIEEEVTPERLIAYLTGDGSVAGLSKADSKKSRGVGGGDCDDSDSDRYPDALCGTTPHFVAEVSEPTATGGRLEVVRGGGTVTVVNTPPTVEDKSAKVCVAADDDPCGPGVWARTTESGSGSGVSVYQVMVQPPRCPRPFPALLYVQRCRSNDQLVYTGGWVIDDAALYEDSETVLSLVGPTEVVGLECCFDYDSDGDGFGDLVERSVSGERARRGARMDSGAVEELVKAGVLSSGAAEGIRKRPGRKKHDVDLKLTHVAVDAPVLHLVSASQVSQDVKFKAGAELSKSVN